MGLCLSKVNTFERDVHFALPSGDGWQPCKLRVRFRVTCNSDEEVKGLRSNREIVDQQVEDVVGLENEGGTAITGAEAVRLLRNHDVVCTAVAKAYITAVNEGADRKN